MPPFQLNNIIFWHMNIFSGEKPGQYQDVLGHQLARLLPNGSLLIESVAQEEEGQYMCEASNGIGVGLSAVVQLTVQGMKQLSDNWINT